MPLGVRRGTQSAAWHLGCGVALRVRRGTNSGASACCKAGPSSNLGSHPRGGPLLSGSDEDNKKRFLKIIHKNISDIRETARRENFQRKYKQLRATR